jgi:hypothetical protein
MKTAAVFPFSVSGSQLQSQTVLVAGHRLSDCFAAADCDCGPDSER